MAAEMDLFFGASQIFCQIFKLAILKTFDQKREHEEEMKKEKEKAKQTSPDKKTKEESKVSDQDEISILEK